MTALRSLSFCGSLLLSIGVWKAAGDELSFTTKDGRRFEQVTVTRMSDQKLEVLTATGLEKITRSDLPADLQARFAKDFNTVAAPKVGEMISFTTTDGRPIKDAILRRIEPTGLTLETRDGFEVFSFAKLPRELGSQFEFDEDEVARHLTEERARQQAIRTRQAAAAELARRQEQQRAAAATPVPAASARTATPVPEARFGTRGERLLGTPRLGGRGLEK